MKQAGAARNPDAGAPPRPAASIVARTSKATQAVLAKIGIQRDFDLVLHLPLRYEDETHLYAIADAPGGQTVLVEGVVTRQRNQVPAEAPAGLHSGRRSQVLSSSAF